MTMPNDDDMFTGNLLGGNKETAVDILSKLLNKADIEMKTDLNMKQIRILFLIRLRECLLRVIRQEKVTVKLDDFTTQEREYTSSMALRESTEYLMQLMVSVGRKSRGESIEGVKKMQLPMNEDGTLADAFQKK